MITDIKTHNAPNDTLIITGKVDGVLTTAYGWQSAVTNHYDAHEGEHRPPSLEPRHMTSEEEQSYYESLLTAKANIMKEVP